MAAVDSTKISVETVEKALNALLKWRKTKTQSEKPQLLEQEDFIYLILTLKKIPPKSRTNAHKIPIPHPLHPNSELCLIIDDRSKSNLTSDFAKKKIKSEDIPITKVIKLSKLKSDYKPFEAKRKLCNSYDLFFADKRIIPLLPRLLGKNFFLKRKIPVPVDLSHKNWKEQIERACSSAMLYLRTGTCSVVKVGKSSMESREIVENVSEAVDGILNLVPKKWDGIRSLHLKFTESVALPIYQAVPDMKLKIDGIKKLSNEVKEEESKQDEKLGGEKTASVKKKKKGRIHEVKYMDGDIGVFGDDSESEADEFDADKENDSDTVKRVKNDWGGSGKKRKKGIDEGIKKSGKKQGGSKKKGGNVVDADSNAGAMMCENETDEDIGKKRSKRSDGKSRKEKLKDGAKVKKCKKKLVAL